LLVKLSKDFLKFFESLTFVFPNLTLCARHPDNKPMILLRVPNRWHHPSIVSKTQKVGLKDRLRTDGMSLNPGT